MTATIKRGSAPEDEKEFGSQAIPVLHKAADNLLYLINQGYKLKGASVFVGNHYLLSERQRLALVRAVSSREQIENREQKRIKDNFADSTLYLDGFNSIITLEVALSQSLLLKCMDGTIRDLAALRGTYRLIDKTKTAITLIGMKLERYQIKQAVFYLDSPVSNSGRLKECILKTLEPFSFQVQVNNIHNVDSVLQELDHVVTADAIILDHCKSWVNLIADIMEENMPDYPYVDFRNIGSKPVECV